MVRMGRTPKGWSKANSKAAKKKNKKLKNQSPTLQIGRVTTNVVANIYGPRLLKVAHQSAEQYAAAMLEYEDALKRCSKTIWNETQQDVDLEGVGACEAEYVPIPPSKPGPFVTQRSLDELQEAIAETSRLMSSSGKWRARANAAKFERLLDEKYGFLRPLMTHPQVEIWIKYLQRKYAMGSISIFREGDPPIGLHTSLIILFMMHRQKVRMDALILSALFLIVGLQPWALVCLVSYGFLWRNRRMKALPAGAKLKSKDDFVHVQPHYDQNNKHQILRQIVGQRLGSEIEETQLAEECSEENSYYDVIILGNQAESLFCGALLARFGRRVLVLSPTDDASGCIQMKNPPNDKFNQVPFDVTDSSVGRIESQQRLLSPALCTTKDAQGGIRFAAIGTEADGFAYEILSVPGMGGVSFVGDSTETRKEPVPFVLRAGGIDAIADDASYYLGDGWHTNAESTNSAIARYILACLSLQADSTQYYYSKLFEQQEAAWASLISGTSWGSDTNYGGAAVRNAGDFLKKLIPINPHVRSLAAAIGCRNEDIKPSETSFAVHLSNIAAAADPSGYFYPVGGPRSLCHALRNTIEQNNGRVVTGISIDHLIFQDIPSKKEDEAKTSSDNKEKVAPKCIAVCLRGGTKLFLNKGSKDDGSIISFLGMVPTFMYIKPEVRDQGGVSPGLPSLKERRPLIHVLMALKGSSADLNLPAADWCRLPSCSLPKDHVDSESGQPVPGNVGGDDVAINTEQAGDAPDGEAGSVPASRSTEGFILDTSKANRPKGASRKYHSGQSFLRISFPSAKDPSWNERHPNISTCVATIEADDDFCRMITSGKPNFAMLLKPATSDIERVLERVSRDVLAQYPNLEGKILAQEIQGPFRSGLSQTPEKFAAKGVRPQTPYPNLFCGGKDLTINSFSGSLVGAWLSAHAVLRYTLLDAVVLQKSLNADLETLLVNQSDGAHEIAVPFTPYSALQNSDLQKNRSKFAKSEDDAAPAEPSRES